MRGYYSSLKESGFFGAYLRHRVWAWNTAFHVPLLAIFPVFSVFAVWYVLLPTTVVIPTFFIGSHFFGADLAAMVVVLSTIAVLLAVLPIMVSMLIDFFPAYFACAGLMFGRNAMAEKMLERSTQELNNWNTIHA